MNLFRRNHGELSLSEYKSIFDLYYDSIRNFLYYKIGDIDIAEDLAQDVFVKIWEKRGEVGKETVKNLLYTMAGNLAKNHFKHKQVVFKYESDYAGKDSSSETPEFEMEMKEFNTRLQQCIDELPEGHREVFLMNRIDKLTYSEIAARLGLSVKAIEKRMHKALKELRSKINHPV